MFVMGAYVYHDGVWKFLQHDIVYLYFLSHLICLVKNYMEGLFFADLFYFCQTCFTCWECSTDDTDRTAHA